MKNYTVIILMALKTNLVYTQDPVLPPVLNHMADSLIEHHEKKFMPWVNTQINDAKQQHKTELQVLFQNKKAEFLRIRGEYDEAIAVAGQAALTSKPLQNWLLTGECYTIIGKAYAGKGDYKNSAKNFIEALKCMEKAGHKQGTAFALNNIGIVYDLQKNYFKAVQYYEQSVKVKLALRDSAGLAAGYNNIGITYYNLNDLEKSATFHKKALVLNLKLKREESIARSYNNLGLVSLKSNQVDKAHTYFSKALPIRLKYKNVKDIATTQNNLAKLWLAKNRADSALFYNKQAFAQGKSIRAYALLKDVYATMADIEKVNKKFERALFYKDTVSLYSDSLINEDNIKSIAEFESRYQYEKLKRTISEKNTLVAQKNERIKTQQAKLIAWIGACAIFIIITVFTTAMYYSGKRKKTMLNAQLILIKERHEQQEIQNKLLFMSVQQKEELITAFEEQTQSLTLTLKEKEQLLRTFYASGKSQELPSTLLSLSERETEVLSHLALGWTDQEIADKLFLSRATVKTHLRRIYSKLLVKGRAEAVSIAHQHKILAYKPLSQEKSVL
ncbi:MAG TPA: tetratricopeptide repeat protein [Flavobacteriales bacterium]|nr:tetratricopeptide repeat protein [Flavobacteriales bacterium]